MSIFLPDYFDIFDNDESHAGILIWQPALSDFLLIALVLLVSVPAHADVTQISGGLDGRALSQDPIWGAGEEGVNLQGAFLNGRHVISDDSGDRYILVAQVDANDNLEELEAYQVYAQVKGPLGRTNLRVGRYILPFGLLANLDTERQLIQALEPVSLGIKLDTGVQIFGFAGPFDYAVSVSQGTGELDDPDSNKLLVARLGMQGEEKRWGFSYLDGRVVTDDEDFLQQGQADRQRYALDAEFDFSSWLLSGELLAGQDNRDSVYGGLLLADYAIDAHLSINTKLGWWNSQDDIQDLALGVTYRLPRNFTLRVADTFQRSNGLRENIVALQLYWEFSHVL